MGLHYAGIVDLPYGQVKGLCFISHGDIMIVGFSLECCRSPSLSVLKPSAATLLVGQF